MIKAVLSGAVIGLIIPLICLRISGEFNIGVAQEWFSWAWLTAVCMMMEPAKKMLIAGILLNMILYLLVFLAFYWIGRGIKKLIR